MTPPPALSNRELSLLDVVARVVSCLSMASASFTVTSYWSCRTLRKKSFNRLAFLIASSNICGSLAYSWGVYPLFAGRKSAFCQAQGFLIEWFVMADPLIVLVMAASVWVRICRQWSSEKVHLLENIGIACAVGLPFIPALVFLCWRPKGLTVYGPAGLWCWISAESNSLRLAAFYGPIWVILLSCVILFSLSGSRIMRTRARVRRVQSLCQPEPRTRKASVTSFRSYIRHSTKLNSFSSVHQPIYNEVRINANGTEEVEPISLAAPTRVHSAPEHLIAPIHSDTGNSISSQVLDRLRSELDSSTRRASRFEAMHWKYARFASLCCFVLLVSWVPISIMRVYNNFINPEHPIVALYYASAVCIPMQGFGNFAVYLTNNWPECRALVMTFVSGSWLKNRGQSDSTIDDGSTTTPGYHH